MIYTFYSFKGGVGRSMALANVAELLYSAGLKVLMVDWDLEAPGLERFFPTPLEKILDHPGLIDMLLDYKKRMSEAPSTDEGDSLLPFESLSPYVADIYPSEVSTKGRLWLLPAGRRSNEHFAEYANAILSFDWKDFYENWEGEVFFEWLRQQLEKKADVVLIDSRTGVTEMGGICTYQLADTVVMLCTGNQQSIDGTFEIARKFRNPGVQELRQGRPLNVLIIPSRVETADSALLDEFQKKFIKVFHEFVSEEEAIDIQQLWNLKIPYVPKYAFTEEVAVRETGIASAEAMSTAFRELSLAMLRVGPYQLFQQVSSLLTVKPDRGFRKLRIFIASASDLESERAKVEMVAAILNPLSDALGIALEVVDWSSVVPHPGRPEQVVLEQMKTTSWDVFIGILWHRFGMLSDSQHQQAQRDHSSGTEEEFKTALRLWQSQGRPRIMLYRCTRAIPAEALDPDQFKRVKDFFTQFEPGKSDYQALYQTFETPEAFEKLLLDNLQRLLLEYGEQIRGTPVESEVVQAFAPSIPDNLPRRAAFFGREREIATVMRALSPEDRTWGVLVDGIGGIGKTALAIEAAYRCKEQGLFDAFIFVTAKQNILVPQGIRELTPPARTLDEFFNETARTLGRADISQLGSDDKRRALLDALRERPTLLIYDNLETLTKDEQETIAGFLRELPQGCKTIITSRRRGGEGAMWLRLEKLEWDAAHQLITEEARKDEGLNRKLQRAGEARWQELYDETKGSPLALAYTLGLMKVRAALTFDGVLEMLRSDSAPELQTFIFQEARRELTINDEAALRALAFFVLSATFEAWMEVAGLSRLALEATIDHLTALSLVDLIVGEDRYALHPLTRKFVHDELLVDGQIARAMGMQFADYWVTYAQRYGGVEDNYKTFNLIEAEWSNLNAAADWLWRTAKVLDKEIGDKNAALLLNYLASALGHASGPLFYLGRWEESLQLNAHAYEAMRALADWSEVGARAYQMAWIHFNRNSTDEAANWADRCTEAWARGGSKHEQAVGALIYGDIARQREDYDTAESLFQEALAIRRGLKLDRNVAMVLNRLGRLEYDREHYDIAEGYYREALEVHEKIASKEGVAISYWGLGLLAIVREQWAEARKWFEKQLPLAREIGRQDLIASGQFSLARVYEAEGQPKLALSLAQEALAIRERLHHKDLPKTRELVERLKKKISE